MRRHRVALSLVASIVAIVAAVVAVALFVSRLEPRACTLMASNPTVEVHLESVDPADLRSGVVEVCRGDACASGELVLRGGPDRTVPAVVRGMPEDESRVTVTLETRSGTLTQSTVVEPTMLYPNGPGCGGESPRASVIWGKDGLRSDD